MVALDPHRIAKLVQDRLREHVATLRVRVLADEVRMESSDGQWWYVPVSIHRDPENMALVYERLSSVEESIEQKEQVSVLLVPRIIPFQKWQDIA